MKTKTIIKYYSIWQLAIIVIAILAPKLLPLRETYLGIGTKTFLQNPLLYSRANFDGNHYIRIAKNGYGYAEEAFFPLYPNIMKLLIPQIKNDTLTGVIISSVAFLFACISHQFLFWRCIYRKFIYTFSIVLLLLCSCPPLVDCGRPGRLSGQHSLRGYFYVSRSSIRVLAAKAQPDWPITSFFSSFSIAFIYAFFAKYCRRFPGCHSRPK